MKRTVALALLLAAGLPAAPGYVDPKLCATCHRQLAADYARTGMGRSFSRATAAAIPTPPVEFHHDRSDTRYAILSRNGEYFQRRWQLGFSGAETNVEELRIDYVLGSGNHARSYLHRTPRGTLIELPFGWYAENGGHWDMSPGSDSTRPMTRRFVSYKCMFCHNGIPQIPAGHDAPDSDPVYTGELPQGIDCQRCHGPGAEHVRTSGNRKAIVNPARLDPVRAMEICMSCHLETSSGRIPASIVRFDRGPFSFLPGEPLANFMLTFDHAPGTGHDDKFEAVSSVYRLRQSQCFLKSEGRLTCTTCHDPHRVPRGAEAVAHYTTVCRQCHEPRPTAAHADTRDCAACHMPKRRAEDTPGMVMTDHKIQRRPPPGDLTARFREREPEKYRGPVVPYYPREVSPLYNAVAQVGLRNNLDAGLPVLVREIAARNPAESEFYVILGEAWMAAGKPPEAIAAYRHATQTPRVQRLLADALGAPPSAADLARAIELDPTLPDQHRRLGDAYLQSGKIADAVDALRKALQIDPGDDAAWDLQGRALAEQSNWPESFYDFDRALRLRPNHATYLYDYGLALARAGRFDEAQTRAQSALAADPNSADAHELLGNLYSRANRNGDAVREYRQALAIRPDSARLRLRLAEALKRR